MALQMATSIIPDTLNGKGGGVFNASSGLNVSWQVNGESPVLAYKIVIQQNNAASTQLYTTGKITLLSPFYGTDYKGETVRFSASAISAADLSSAGITNGNDYKMVITQWWGASDTDSVTQSSAAYIEARSAATVTMDTITSPVTSHAHTFTATASIGTGDGIEWVRWYLSYTGNDSEPIFDSGYIYGTSQLRMDYDTLMTGKAYDIKCEIQTQSGLTANTGWVPFTVNYTVTVPTGSIEVYQSCTRCGIMVSWTALSGADGYSLFRMDRTTNTLKHIADFEGELSFMDYGVQNHHTYYYQLYKMEDGEYTTSALTSEDITACKWDYALLRTKLEEDGAYHVKAEYLLSCNVDSGTVTSNNKPKVQETFSRYPNWQSDTALYNSGTLNALIGRVNKSTNEYENDTASLAQEIRELGISDATLFLKDRKGNLYMVRLNGAVTTDIEDTYPNQATKVSIPWVEVGDASECIIIAVGKDGMFNSDNIVSTTVTINPATGMLVWAYANDYLSKPDNGSVLRMYGDKLSQDTDSVKLSIASMEIIRSTQELFGNNSQID